MTELAVLLSALSPDEHERGREFELICGWLLEHSPLYRPFVRKVWCWQDWPDRWGGDSGVDLVVETHEGELWAVQAKAYASSYYLKKADIDSFLSESSRPCFAYRLLIATTDLIGPRAESALRGQTVPVGRLLKSDLEDLALEWPVDPAVLTPAAERPKVEPHAAARRALRDITEGLSTADRGQVVMACGTGKTLVGLWAAERLAAQSVLVMLPSLSLLSQTMREWTDNWAVARRVAGVCSDASVTDGSVASVSELAVPVTTEAAALLEFLRRPGPQVVFATYHSAAVVAEACRLSGVSFDLLIADEAHRIAGPARGKFALATDAEALPATKRLFMTATPRVYTQRAKAAAEEDSFDVLSMDDASRFGPVLHRLGFATAVEEGLLTDYEVIVTAVTDETLRRAIDERRLVDPEGLQEAHTLDARTLSSLATVVRATEKYSLRRTVSFHSRVAAAKSFSERLPLVADWLGSTASLAASYVSGAMPSGQRRSRLAQLAEADAARPRVLANARCLTEGVNVPNLDAIAFVDPRQSQIDIVQAVGRVMRKSPDKVVGRIVLPVFVPAPDDASGLRLDDTEFATVLQVVRALRAHDETLADELDEIRRAVGRWGAEASRLPKRLVLDLPATYTPGMLDALTLRVLEGASPSWPFMFGLLERFAAREGHARPVGRHAEAGAPLGGWVVRQRVADSRGSLSRDRRAALESLPGWSWDPLEDRWQEFFELLLAFVAREGHARVPTEHEEGGEQLGKWVNLQRRTKFDGSIGSDREERLAALPDWTWNVVRDSWLRGFAALTAYAQEYGHCVVPQIYLSPGGFALGRWVQEQRKQQAKRLLPAEDRAQLEALPGWEWRPRDNKFALKVAAMERFVAREGHARVPGGHREGEVDLGVWVRQCRRKHAQGLLREEVRTYLDGLVGWSWTERLRAAQGPAALTDTWRARLTLLHQFVERESHADVPQKHSEGDFRLGSWVTAQRHQYRSGALHADAVEALEAVPGWSWDTRQAIWDRKYAALAHFARAHGHCFPAFKSDDHTIALWAREQRRARRNGVLPADRAQLLEILPGWSWAYGPTARAPRAG